MNDEEPDKALELVDNPGTSVVATYETLCWGCGLQLLLSSYSPIFKCGWCGAITNQKQNSRKPDSACFSKWRHLQDCFFVTVLSVFVLFVICAGLWAICPVIFSISVTCGIFHCTVTAILAICTISTFLCASFRSPGEPAIILWGSYPIVAKGGLENYTFCTYCAKPKCPRTHHCRSCRICVLDMDHHCPFIGNCVGAANHRFFVAFLVSIIISCTYVVGMAAFVVLRIWPPLEQKPHSLTHLDNFAVSQIIKDALASVASAMLVLSIRGLVLIYLAMACFSVEIGISVLLWQQLQFIYQGKTYMDHIRSEHGAFGERGFQNILRFFNCPYWAFRLLLGTKISGKLQETSYSKIL